MTETKIKTKIINAKEIFLKNRRFDLIFKYLYLKNHNKYSTKTSFFEDLYCEHIRAFNNFHEGHPSDGIPKESKEDFLNSFNNTYKSIIKNGFDENQSIVTIGNGYELTDASHRVAVCAYLDKDVVTKEDVVEEYYDYKFFNKRSIDKSYADYAALEYVKFNKNAYIVNLHSVTNKKYDSQVEEILNKYGFIFYKKDIYLSFNGYVNLKKISYGFDIWDGASWIGDVKNSFIGARDHAKRSMGSSPLRAFVFVCDDLEKVVKAKAEIRAIYDIGNYSVHINDSREEAIQLAQTYFNENSLFIINARSLKYEDKDFDNLVEELKEIAKNEKIDIDEICASGSTPFSVLGIRKSRDLDFLYCGEKPFETGNPILSNHDSELDYYPYDKTEIIMNPKYHFYYRGLKFITLDVLYEMKKKRNEIPKDVKDCKLIKKFKKRKIKVNEGFKIFKKEKSGLNRKVTILGIIKIQYTKKT